MKEYAIRIWLQPDRLASAGLTPMDVASAVREQNSQFSTGRIGEEPMPRIVDETISITTQGRLSDPKEFEQIILRAERGGKIIRLGDVARVELGARDYSGFTTQRGKPALIIRSEEHTSELQSLMRISSAVFCLKKKK